MSISKQTSRKTRQSAFTGDKQVTGTLDATTTTEIIQLSVVAQKVTVQGLGTLVGTFEVSANGNDFVAGGSVAVASLNSYSANLVVAVKVIRSAGSGKAVVLAA